MNGSCLRISRLGTYFRQVIRSSVSNLNQLPELSTNLFFGMDPAQISGRDAAHEVRLYMYIVEQISAETVIN